MAEYLIKDTTLTSIADAIRSKTGEPGAIQVSQYAEKIQGIVIPKLYSPTSIQHLNNATTNKHYFRVTIPTSNGDFIDKVQLTDTFANGEMVVVAEKDATGTTIDLYASDCIYEPGIFLFQPEARCVGDGFIPSDNCPHGNYWSSLTKIQYNITGASATGTDEYAFYEDIIVLQLTPNEGYYLPKKVSLRENDGTTSPKTYTYNSENGNLTIAIDMASSTDPVCLNVNVECVDIPWLRTPSIEVDQLQSLLNITPTKNTSNIKVSIDNELVEEVSATNGCSYNIVDLNTTYGFSLNSSTGYYVSENANKPSSYAICKLNISAEKPSILKLLCINQNEAGFDYGMLSELDTVLKSSSTADTSGVYKTFKGITSSAPQEVIYDIPAGEHFIYIKRIKDNSTNTSPDTFQFKVDSITSVSSVCLTDHIDTYGTYDISAIGCADGYTDSDPVTTKFIYQPQIVIENGILRISNTVPSNVTGFELYIDNELVSTVAYDGVEAFSANIFDFIGTDLIKRPEIYIKALGPDVQSNILNNWIVPAGDYPVYGVSGLYSSTTSLTRTDDAVGMTYTKNSDGSIISAFNDVFPWNKTSIVTDDAGNEFVSFPQMFFRVTCDSVSRLTSVAVSEVPHDSGDWYEVKPFWYGRYGASLTGSVLESKRGKTRAASETRSMFRTYAEANGEGYHQLDLYHNTVLKFLWWIEWAHKNSVSIMTGTISGSGTVGGTSILATGSTDNVTTPSGYELTRHQMRYHYIEDFIGSLMEWMDGVKSNGPSTSYSDFVTSDITNYSQCESGGDSMVALSYKNCSNNNIAGIGWDANNPFMCVPTYTVSNTNYSTYFCDNCSRNTNYPCIYTGAAYNAKTTYNGITYYYATSTTAAYASVGARLLKSHFV